jgi:hypothetical protein
MSGWTPLHELAAAGKLYMVKQVVKYGELGISHANRETFKGAVENLGQRPIAKYCTEIDDEKREAQLSIICKQSIVP